MEDVVNLIMGDSVYLDAPVMIRLILIILMIYVFAIVAANLRR